MRNTFVNTLVELAKKDRDIEPVSYTHLDLLARRDDEGRITTYSKECEFSGWDMWGRKYAVSYTHLRAGARRQYKGRSYKAQIVH